VPDKGKDKEIVVIQEDEQVGNKITPTDVPTLATPASTNIRGSSYTLTVTVSVLGVLFILPWIFIAVCQIKKRIAAREVLKIKEDKQKQLLRISDYGREIRRQLHGPNGEDF